MLAGCEGEGDGNEDGEGEGLRGDAQGEKYDAEEVDSRSLFSCKTGNRNNRKSH